MGRPGLRAYLPGLTLAVAGSLAAGLVADHYGAPITVMALLIGLALNFLNGEDRLVPGSSLRHTVCCEMGLC